ncbi:MAG: FprA family A-type flavoprotein [Brevinema sp.]
MNNCREITKNLYYVGADDHRVDLFENIHPIDWKGVSYNSYVLLDEKTVVFDTVDWAVVRPWLDNIRDVLDGRQLDYLVVNHMEPDHCAGIEELALRYPEMKIISTEKSFLIMNQLQYSGLEGRTITVKEGDTMTFGSHTVAFLEAPMVHWPETMVTMDVTNGVLFSADGFGSFNALDGRLFADEVNYDRDWIDENRRYFTNIVGKYGPFVQYLLGKVVKMGLLEKIKIICPLHGLLWRRPEDISYILDKYQKWSTYTPEQKGVLIAYASMYGNTEDVAQLLAQKLVMRGMTNVVMRDVSRSDISWLVADTFRLSHLVLASVTYNLEIYPKMYSFLHDLKILNMQNRTVSIIENGSWAPTSGSLMKDFVNGMKKMDVLNEELTIISRINDAKMTDIDAIADGIIESMKK